MTSRLQFTKSRLKVCRKIRNHPHSINWTHVVAERTILCRGQVSLNPTVEPSKASTKAVKVLKHKKWLSRGIRSNSIKCHLCRPSIILLLLLGTTSSSRVLIKAKCRTFLTMECRATISGFTKTSALNQVSTAWCSQRVLSTFLNATTN
jgi:hypothetical protein